MSDTHETAASPNLAEGAEPGTTTSTEAMQEAMPEAAPEATGGPDTGHDDQGPKLESITLSQNIARIVAACQKLEKNGVYANSMVASIAIHLEGTVKAYEDKARVRAFVFGALTVSKDSEGTFYGTGITMSGSPVLLDSLSSIIRRRVDNEHRNIEMRREVGVLLRGLMK